LRIKLASGLLLLNLLVIALVAAITFIPDNVLRIILGIPFVLFFPGYALVVALFPGKGRMDSIERVAYSFGLSLAVVPLTALVFNYTPWGISLEPILYCVSSFTLITSVIAWVRWRRLPKGEQFVVEFHPVLPGWVGGARVRLLSIILVIVIVGGVAALGYTAAVPRVGERFTEFYILGLEGGASGYIRELAVGEEGSVILDIVNHEKAEVSYRVEVTIDGERNTEVGPVVLGDEQKWEEIIGFAPKQAGKNQKVEFWLYKNEDSEPHMKPIYLWLDVKGGS